MSIYQTIAQAIGADPFYQRFPNDGQRFVAWYLRNIHHCNMNETKDAITDGPDDKQIDAVVFNDEKSIIYIIQGKYYSEGAINAEPVREVLSSWMQLRDIVRLQQVSGNSRLQRKLSEIANMLEDDYEIVFELVTTGKFTQAARDDLESFQRQLANISDTDSFSASIELVDEDELQRRLDASVEREYPQINYVLDLCDSMYQCLTIANTQVILAALPLKKCLDFPGIKDGTLFKKNVRQSLGTRNPVNKGIRQTIMGDRHSDFFFFHNGITAICNEMILTGNQLSMKGLNIVNGCQSLNTILSCSETVKKLDDTYIMFRFYEIPQRERADRISINTNSQSTVKARDLRSNDKRVLSLKRLYETRFSQGYFITKRGEEAPADKDEQYIVDLSQLGKNLIAWHSQRPNISYGETKIFDKYFEILFRREYNPDDIFALNAWISSIKKAWTDENPLDFNEALLAMRAYAPYHQLYSVSILFCVVNKVSDRVPHPYLCWKAASQSSMVDDIVRITGVCLNGALESAIAEAQAANKVFSPQNWVKAKACLVNINAAIRQNYSMMGMMGAEAAGLKARLDQTLRLLPEAFEYRWAAD